MNSFVGRQVPQVVEIARLIAGTVEERHQLLGRDLLDPVNGYLCLVEVVVLLVLMKQGLLVNLLADQLANRDIDLQLVRICTRYWSPQTYVEGVRVGVRVWISLQEVRRNADALPDPTCEPAPFPLDRLPRYLLT